MAESSSTSAPASTSTAANSDYDVFVNHRGPDVKKTFASHLYRRLRSHGLRVFLDQLELQQGDGLTPQIEGAIRSASVHVAIFSSGYAESAWCLKELVLMQKSNFPIIPVFYNAQPSDLKPEEGRYARALEDLKKKIKVDPETDVVSLLYDSNTIGNWRTALSSVKDIVGFNLEKCNSDEGELVDQVVESVLRKVKKPALDVATYPTGLDDKINDFENTVLLPLQQSGKPQILGIWGLGGVGKTTLAKEFFNRRKSDYSRSCFLFDVREYARKGTLDLVKRNLLECLTGLDHPIHSVPEGIARSSANALVIIDDVDSEDQVDALLSHQSVLHSNSLILITSRYKNVLTRGDKNRSIYKLEGLNPPQAEELFCCYAFNQPHPLPEFKSLVNKFLKTCDGLPLSLKVFGALLNGNYDKRYWQYLLEKLEVQKEIRDKLQISFDSLTETEQNMFLDMACFFIGEDRDMAIKIWEGSGWEGSSWDGLWSFQNIQDKCLVEVDSENKIKMHDHLRDLGRDLAKASGLPRRLWSWNDIEDLLKQSCNGPVIPVRGIKLDSSESNDIPVEDALGRICKWSLQLLDGEGVLVESILAKVPSPNLRWLRWKNCPCSSLPSSISMKNLRVLHLEGERLGTLWQNESQAPLKLRELEILNYHWNIPNSVWKFPKSIGKLKHLERIVIPWRIWGPRFIKLSEEFCLLPSLKVLISLSPMESLPECFGNLTKLHHIVLNLSGLKRLPESFSNLTSLHRIELSQCRRLESLPESFGKLTNLHRIELSMCRSLKSLPESFGNLINLHRIELSECFSLQSLPESFGNLTNLHHIQLSGCRALERLPDSFVKLINLKHLNLKHISLCLRDKYLKELPSAIGKLSDLEVLVVGGPLLDTLPPSLCDLKNLKLLDINGCKELKCLPASLGDLKNLKDLQICFCNGLKCLPSSLGDLRNLKKLSIWCCKRLECLPPSLGLLTQLTELTVADCRLIRELPFTGERDSSIHNCILPGLRSLKVQETGISEVSFAEGVCCNLRSLIIYSCNNVVEVGTLPNTLTELTITDCLSLRKIDKIHGLAKLQLLNINNSIKLKELPRIETLVSLSTLDVSGCVKLKRIRGLGQLTNLQWLDVSNCSELEEVEGIQDCTSLQSMYAFECPKLQCSAEVVEQLKQRRLLLL